MGNRANQDISSTRSSLGQSCSPGETVVKGVDEFQDLKAKSGKIAKREDNLSRKYQSYSKLQEIKRRECEREVIEVPIIRNTKTQNGKSTRQVKELEKIDSVINCNYHEKGKHKVSFDEFESNHRGRIKQPNSNIKLVSDSFEYPSHSSKIPISPSKGKNLEDTTKKVVERSEPKVDIAENRKLRKTSPNRMLGFDFNRHSRRSSSLDLSFESVRPKIESKKDVNYLCSEISKLRNPSPTRRFSFRLNRFSQRSISLDFSSVPQLSSEHDPYISHSKNDSDFRLEKSNHEKPNIGRKSQMSPLRRFLDPLLKPKAVTSYYSADSSEKDSEKMYSRRFEQSNGKNKPLKVQALVQLSIKNGLPLYTFADDKTNGVLAATMKKVTALKKGDGSWIYTFFNIDEVKKKNSWINKARKGETHGYVPIVIAQMRVSDIRHDPLNNFSTREFVSFSVDVTKDDQQTSNFRPKDELAAILVKFPKEAHLRKEIIKRGSDYVNDPSFSITTILPGGSHGLPSKGKPSPLIERWKSGGLCDCGGWDLGCRLKVVISQGETNRRLNISDTYLAANVVELFPQGEVVDDQPIFILSPFKDNIYSVEFDSSLSFLQAFSICISILNCRKPCDLSELSKLFEEKTENSLKAGDVIKAPNPPLSPVGRV